LYQINFFLTFLYLRPDDLPPDEPEPELRDVLLLPDDFDELLLETEPEPDGALTALAEPELFLERNEFPLFCDDCWLVALLTDGVLTG
jgi:hypothetical protein